MAPGSLFDVGQKKATLLRSAKCEFLPCDRVKMAKVRKDAQEIIGEDLVEILSKWHDPSVRVSESLDCRIERDWSAYMRPKEGMRTQTSVESKGCACLAQIERKTRDMKEIARVCGKSAR